MDKMTKRYDLGTPDNVLMLDGGNSSDGLETDTESEEILRWM